MKCYLLLGDWLPGRADMAPDISKCTCGFWSFAVVEMCESGGPNPPSHYQFDVLQLYKIVFFFKFLRLIPVLRRWVVCCGHRVDVLLVVGVGVARPPVLCVAQNERLHAHRNHHCCLTWIFCVKWNMSDQGFSVPSESRCAPVESRAKLWDAAATWPLVIFVAVAPKQRSPKLSVSWLTLYVLVDRLPFSADNFRRPLRRHFLSIFKPKMSLERSFPALNHHVLLLLIEGETAEQGSLKVWRPTDFANNRR